MLWTVHLSSGKSAPKRLNQRAVIIGDTIYTFGGYFYVYRMEQSIEVFACNTNRLRWDQVPFKIEEDGSLEKNRTILMQRRDHTAVTYQGEAYVWGGRYHRAACPSNILCRFSPKTLSWTCLHLSGTIPAQRSKHSACVIDQYMYIFGGIVYEYGVEESSNEVYCVDLHTMKWRLIETSGTPPALRHDHSAVGLNGRMYILGGTCNSSQPADSFCSQIFYLDIKTRVWHRPRTTGTVPIPRTCLSMFTYKELIYVFGGYNPPSHQDFNDLHVFDPSCNNWKLVIPVGRPPLERSMCACVIKDDRMFLFGGTTPECRTILPNDLHVLDFKPTLRNLAISAALEYKLDTKFLPREIQEDMRLMTPPRPPLAHCRACRSLITY